MQSFSESLNSVPLALHKNTWNQYKANVTIADEWELELIRGGEGGPLNVSLYHSVHKTRLSRSHSTSTALQLYSTIWQTVEQYLSEFPVTAILFAASEPKMAPVYTRLANKIAKQTGGKISKATVGGYTGYQIVLPDHPAFSHM